MHSIYGEISARKVSLSYTFPATSRQLFRGLDIVDMLPFSHNVLLLLMR